MNRVRGLLALLGLVVALWGAAGVQAQQPPLVVEGQVVNATLDGGPISGLTVVFHQHSVDGRQEDLETTTDAEGRFRFEGVVVAADFLYGISLEYQGVLYGQDMDLSGGLPAPLTLTVYEATDREEVLRAAGVSVLFSEVEAASRTVGALEIVTIENTSDRAYVPGLSPMSLLRFGLPPGAQGLQVDTTLLGAEVLPVESGFALRASVPPGQHQVMYTYHFPYSGSRASFSRSLPYGAGLLRVLAPEGVLEISSTQLGSPGHVTVGGGSYQLLEASDLPRGMAVTVDLAGLPRASLGSRVGQRLSGLRLEYVAPVGVGILAAVLLAFALMRRGRRPLLAAGQGRALPAAAERQVLLREMAELDRQLASGALTAEEHQRRRERLRGRLAALLRSAQEEPPDDRPSS